MTDSLFPRLVLAKGREKSLLRRHPWIFSGGVARMEGKARSGETIDIVDHQGKWLARGAYSPSSQIRARVWTFDRNEAIDSTFFERRLQQAQTWRAWLAERDGLDSYRLIAGESDGLPGVTIDRFGNFFVLQLLSAGAEYQRAAIISALQNLFPDCAIYDRSDVAVRKKEGLELAQGPVIGIAEAAMHMATMVATRFSIVTTLPRTLIIARHLLHQYGFHQHCAALHAIDLPVLALEDGSGLAQEKVRERCIRALKEDGSGAIVLGCGGMATLAQELTRELRVPVIDGVSAAVKMVESLVALGLATSKHGDLAFPEKKALSGQFQSLNPF